MAFTTLSVRLEVARKLKAVKAPGESYSDTLERLLENLPAKSVGEWLKSLQPLEGHGILTAANRERLRQQQHAPRRSPRKPRAFV